uniref:G-protein coupled receptors family 2 profile 2 domain-containing protein n=1 Tax=Sinocyclocheilus grahami TaxID=75366 RepID=A0A672MLK5_SINGR
MHTDSAHISHCPPSEKVTKVCASDGRWFRHPESNRLWSNYTQCSAYTKHKLEVRASLLLINPILQNPDGLPSVCLPQLTLVNYYLAMVGHVLSIISLLISICIFSYFKCLSCQRITLHKNMFTSFILNSFATIGWFYFVVGDQRTRTDSIGCKLLASIMQYTSCSSYFWMLCEGIYLHTLIIVAVFVGEQQLGWYYVLGWGIASCWQRINVVSLSTRQVNLFFLLNIVRVLITKLRVTHRSETNVYMKAVRATIILVPLLGAQFILMPLEPSGRVSLAVYDLLMNIFVHFQVMNLSLYVSIQRCKFNLCAKLECRIKHLRIKHRFHPTSQKLFPSPYFNAHFEVSHEKRVMKTFF